MVISLSKAGNTEMFIGEPFVKRYWLKNSRSFVKSYREDFGSSGKLGFTYVNMFQFVIP